MAGKISVTRRRKQRGSEVVEFGLVCLPLFGFVFLIVDIAWIIFAQVSLQSAVREGVRYAVTGQTLAGMGQDDSIKQVVENQAAGFLSGPGAASLVKINYYMPTTLAATASNAQGNIVEVSIDGFALSPVGPILHSGAAVAIAARASDIVEPSPNGTPPAR